MTKFDELQQAHQSLLDRADEVTDITAFANGEVQAYVTRACEEAVDVSNPRDRDQLRANLRYWASYIYDATGTYPSTSMRPARAPEAPKPAEPPPPSVPVEAPRHSPLIWIILALGAALVLLALAFLFRPTVTSAPAQALPTDSAGAIATRVQEQVSINATLTVMAVASASPTQTPANDQPTETPLPTGTLSSGSEVSTPTPVPTSTAVGNRITPTPSGALVVPEISLPIRVTPLVTQAPPPPGPFDSLRISALLLTRGPSPFEPTVWVAKIRLAATGGNGVYVFWIDGERYPADEYTVEARSCQPVTVRIGVTSNGQSNLGAIRIEPPNACGP